MLNLYLSLFGGFASQSFLVIFQLLKKQNEESFSTERTFELVTPALPWCHIILRQFHFKNLKFTTFIICARVDQLLTWGSGDPTFFVNRKSPPQKRVDQPLQQLGRSTSRAQELRYFSLDQDQRGRGLRGLCLVTIFIFDQPAARRRYVKPLVSPVLGISEPRHRFLNSFQASRRSWSWLKHS